MSFFKFLTLWDTANIKNGREEARGGGDCPKGRAQASGAGKARETSSCEKSYVRQSSNCCLSLDGEVCSVFRVIRHHLKIDKVSYETKLFWCNIIRKRISFFPVFPHLSSRPSVQALLPSPILVLFFQVLAVVCYRQSLLSPARAPAGSISPASIYPCRLQTRFFPVGRKRWSPWSKLQRRRHRKKNECAIVRLRPWELP